MSQGPEGLAPPSTDNNAAQNSARPDYADSAYQVAQKPSFPEIKDYLISGIIKVEYADPSVELARVLSNSRLFDSRYQEIVSRGDDPEALFDLIENLSSIKISSSTSASTGFKGIKKYLGARLLELAMDKKLIESAHSRHAALVQRFEELISQELPLAEERLSEVIRLTGAYSSSVFALRSKITEDEAQAIHNLTGFNRNNLISLNRSERIVHIYNNLMFFLSRGVDCNMAYGTMRSDLQNLVGRETHLPAATSDPIMDHLIASNYIDPGREAASAFREDTGIKGPSYPLRPQMSPEVHLYNAIGSSFINPTSGNSRVLRFFWGIQKLANNYARIAATAKYGNSLLADESGYTTVNPLKLLTGQKLRYRPDLHPLDDFRFSPLLGDLNNDRPAIPNYFYDITADSLLLSGLRTFPPGDFEQIQSFLPLEIKHTGDLNVYGNTYSQLNVQRATVQITTPNRGQQEELNRQQQELRRRGGFGGRGVEAALNANAENPTVRHHPTEPPIINNIVPASASPFIRSGAPAGDVIFLNDILSKFFSDMNPALINGDSGAASSLGAYSNNLDQAEEIIKKLTYSDNPGFSLRPNMMASKIIRKFSDLLKNIGNDQCMSQLTFLRMAATDPTAKKCLYQIIKYRFIAYSLLKSCQDDSIRQANTPQEEFVDIFRSGNRQALSNTADYGSISRAWYLAQPGGGIDAPLGSCEAQSSFHYNSVYQGAAETSLSEKKFLMIYDNLRKWSDLAIPGFTSFSRGVTGAGSLGLLSRRDIQRKESSGRPTVNMVMRTLKRRQTAFTYSEFDDPDTVPQARVNRSTGLPGLRQGFSLSIATQTNPLIRGGNNQATNVADARTSSVVGGVINDPEHNNAYGEGAHLQSHRYSHSVETNEDITEALECLSKYEFFNHIIDDSRGNHNNRVNTGVSSSRVHRMTLIKFWNGIVNTEHGINAILGLVLGSSVENASEMQLVGSGDSFADSTILSSEETVDFKNFIVNLQKDGLIDEDKIKFGEADGEETIDFSTAADEIRDSNFFTESGSSDIIGFAVNELLNIEEKIRSEGLASGDPAKIHHGEPALPEWQLHDTGYWWNTYTAVNKLLSDQNKLRTAANCDGAMLMHSDMSEFTKWRNELQADDEIESWGFGHGRNYEAPIKLMVEILTSLGDMLYMKPDLNFDEPVPKSRLAGLGGYTKRLTSMIVDNAADSFGYNPNRNGDENFAQLLSESTLNQVGGQYGQQLDRLASGDTNFYYTDDGNINTLEDAAYLFDGEISQGADTTSDGTMGGFGAAGFGRFNSAGRDPFAAIPVADRQQSGFRQRRENLLANSRIFTAAMIQSFYQDGDGSVRGVQAPSDPFSRFAEGGAQANDNATIDPLTIWYRLRMDIDETFHRVNLNNNTGDFYLDPNRLNVTNLSHLADTFGNGRGAGGITGFTRDLGQTLTYLQSGRSPYGGLGRRSFFGAVGASGLHMLDIDAQTAYRENQQEAISATVQLGVLLTNVYYLGNAAEDAEETAAAARGSSEAFEEEYSRQVAEDRAEGGDGVIDLAMRARSIEMADYAESQSGLAQNLRGRAAIQESAARNIVEGNMYVSEDAALYEGNNMQYLFTSVNDQVIVDYNIFLNTRIEVTYPSNYRQLGTVFEKMADALDGSNGDPNPSVLLNLTDANENRISSHTQLAEASFFGNISNWYPHVKRLCDPPLPVILHGLIKRELNTVKNAMIPFVELANEIESALSDDPEGRNETLRHIITDVDYRRLLQGGSPFSVISSLKKLDALKSISNSDPGEDFKITKILQFLSLILDIRSMLKNSVEVFYDDFRMRSADSNFVDEGPDPLQMTDFKQSSAMQSIEMIGLKSDLIEKNIIPAGLDPQTSLILVENVVYDIGVDPAFVGVGTNLTGRADIVSVFDRVLRDSPFVTSSYLFFAPGYYVTRKNLIESFLRDGSTDAIDAAINVLTAMGVDFRGLMEDDFESRNRAIINSEAERFFDSCFMRCKFVDINTATHRTPEEIFRQDYIPKFNSEGFLESDHNHLRTIIYASLRNNFMSSLLMLLTTTAFGVGSGSGVSASGKRSRQFMELVRDELRDMGESEEGIRELFSLFTNDPDGGGNDQTTAVVIPSLAQMLELLKYREVVTIRGLEYEEPPVSESAIIKMITLFSSKYALTGMYEKLAKTRPETMIEFAHMQYYEYSGELGSYRAQLERFLGDDNLDMITNIAGQTFANGAQGVLNREGKLNQNFINTISRAASLHTNASFLKKQSRCRFMSVAELKYLNSLDFDPLNTVPTNERYSGVNLSDRNQD